MKLKHNIVGWFEIPVKNMERAMKFYEKVLGMELERNKMGDLDMAWFPFVDKGMGAGGSLVKHKMYKPSSSGVLVYLSASSGDCKKELGKVKNAGGKILMSKKIISKDYGYMGLALDTEGNRIAIHSRK